MKKKIFIIPVLVIFTIAFILLCQSKTRKHKCDVAIMGKINFDDGIGRQAIGIIDALRHDFSVQYAKFGDIERRDMPKAIKPIVVKKYKTSSHVLFFEDCLLFPDRTLFPRLPDALVKIAYSMIESTKIPQNWVKILNQEFDAVCVPDEFLVKVYESCGVRIPVFVLPLGMYLEDFLSRSCLRDKPIDRPFVFGNFGTYLPRKNQINLIEAFAKAFGNNPKVKLVLNGRAGETEYLRILQEKKKSLGLDNVTITNIQFEWKRYIEEINSLDCYVSPSMGEGFSLQPREALACGIPSIVTNNTCQSTICKSGYVRSVESPILVKAYYRIFQNWHDDLGCQFNCDIDTLAIAMKDVYDNYEFYAKKTVSGKNWVEQYSYKKLFPLYRTFVLPKQVILSDHNTIEGGILYTTSLGLKKKYEKIIAKQNFWRKIANRLIIWRQ